MKANSVFFPLTNPSPRLDKGRRLAASESACRNLKTTAALALIRRSSGGCRFKVDHFSGGGSTDLMYQFGSWLQRFRYGGITLEPAEQWLLVRLVGALPEKLRGTVAAQLNAYNRAQREIDGRAINLYARPSLPPDMPLLMMSVSEAPLVRLTVRVAGVDRQLHASLAAVSGRVFCMTLSQPVKGIEPSRLEVCKLTQAWRSNFAI
ncbi:MAG: hypothetical protein NT037_07100 [Hyphomicrobiales bacterium]|nr:hypothetical protein [Hyphomicrobiales bacterium]